MNCKCGGRYVVRQTYTAGPTGKTSRLQCEKCGQIATAVTVIKNVNPRIGQGAYSLAAQMRLEAEARKQ